MKIKRNKSAREWVLIIVFYLLTFQNPLESVLLIFKYIDEMFALVGLLYILCKSVRQGVIRIRKGDLSIVRSLLCFLAIGILGNIIYQYQPMEAVLIDIFTNLKFFLSIISGYVLFQLCEPNQDKSIILGHAQFASAFLFALLCVDLVFSVYPSSETRYGLRVIQLFYGHCTYLAGTMAFLLAVLMLFYERKNIPYIVMSLLVLFFTLRGKALAGVVLYIFIGYFFLYHRRKLKLWHFIMLGAGALFIAWDQFSYYYLEFSDTSARAVLTTTSFEIAKDYFPIGTGFGTFASASAAEYYSPVYYQYGLNYIWGLSDTGANFGSDTFWPIILGQTGVIGTICFVRVLWMLFRRMLNLRTVNLNAYAVVIFIFSYLLVSSTSEAAFHNAISIPLAMLLGYAFTIEKRKATIE